MRIADLQAATATTVDQRTGECCHVCGRPAVANDPFSEWRGAVRPYRVCARHWAERAAALAAAGVDLQSIYPYPPAA